MNVTTQFTEDALADVPSRCARSSCSALIPVGARCHYIASHNASREGKFVCEVCFNYYLKRPATAVRGSSVNDSRQTGERSGSQASTARIQSLDVQSIRESVNGAQRKNSAQVGWKVTAVPLTFDSQQSQLGVNMQGYSMMPPPSAFPGYSQATVPNVGVPSAWSSRAGDFLSSSATPSALGYTASHGLYAAERERWSKMSYQSMIGETISITMQVLHEVPGKTKAVLVANLHEGKTNIPASTTPAYLRHVLLTCMKPKLEAMSKGFQFNWTTIIVREVTSWVDLSTEEQEKPYLYERCLVDRCGKDKKKMFKKPSRPFVFALVIGADQWDRFLEFLACRDLEEQEKAQDIRVKNGGARLQQPASTPQEWSDDEGDIIPSPTPSNRLFQETEITLSRLSSPEVTPSRSVAAPHHTMRTERTTMSKRSRALSTTSPSQAPSTLISVSKRQRLVEYTSPDRNRFREALLHGGSSSVESGDAFSELSERIEFFPILSRPLQELLADKSIQSFACDSDNARPGTICVKHQQMLGIGTFKTAHRGRLCLTPLSDEGLGTTLNELVAVKRMYFRETEKKQGKKRQGTGTTNIVTPSGLGDEKPVGRIARYTAKTELIKMIDEGNIMYWSNSLIDFTYAFIDNTVTTSDIPPPFSIPRFRFVHAGLAVVHDQSGSAPASTSVSMRRVYLVEEFINEKEEPFVKYIHNGHAVPIIEQDDPFYELAQFLSFTQHVQYSKSGEQVYISDLQGSRTLLTDPQIMTAPSIKDDLFGEGNVGDAFSSFSSEHICNHYCDWFKLPTLSN